MPPYPSAIRLIRHYFLGIGVYKEDSSCVNRILIPKGAKAENRSFDYFIGAQQQSLWNCQTHCFRGPEVDHQLEFDRLLHRKIAGFLPPQNLGDIACCAPTPGNSAECSTTASRDIFGKASRRSLTRLAPISGLGLVSPVMFPPGYARLATNPSSGLLEAGHVVGGNGLVKTLEA